MVLECRATHTGTGNPLRRIPSRKAEVSLASADAELRHYVSVAPEWVVGEADEGYGGCGECEVQPRWYALAQADVDDIRTLRPTAANAQAEKNIDKTETHFLTPVPFLFPTAHLLIFTIFPFHIRFTGSTVLNPLDDFEDGLLPQPFLEASSYHVPKGMRDTHGLPVPDIGTGS